MSICLCYCFLQNTLCHMTYVVDVQYTLKALELDLQGQVIIDYRPHNS